MSTEHLLLRLEGPLMSFGAPTVDSYGPTQRWPAVSMLTGLIANALGFRRTQVQALARLQSRLVWAARIDRPGALVKDLQTAQLDAKDRGWTTFGEPEARAGGAESFKSPHLRHREFWADASVALALRLREAREAPTLNDVADALQSPARPLFLGRKACLPSAPLYVRTVQAPDTVSALELLERADGARPSLEAFSNDSAAEPLAVRQHLAADERRFDLDVHAGRVTVFEYRVVGPQPRAATPMTGVSA